MAKLTTKKSGGTSFHDVVLTTTVEKLRKVLGNPQYESNDGRDESNFDWTCETKSKKIFTIYDWKHYRPIKETDEIEFHIGGHCAADCLEGLNEVRELLDTLAESEGDTLVFYAIAFNRDNGVHIERFTVSEQDEDYTGEGYSSFNEYVEQSIQDKIDEYEQRLYNCYVADEKEFEVIKEEINNQ